MGILQLVESTIFSLWTSPISRIPLRLLSMHSSYLSNSKLLDLLPQTFNINVFSDETQNEVANQSQKRKLLSFYGVLG